MQQAGNQVQIQQIDGRGGAEFEQVYVHTPEYRKIISRFLKKLYGRKNRTMLRTTAKIRPLFKSNLKK